MSTRTDHHEEESIVKALLSDFGNERTGPGKAGGYALAASLLARETPFAYGLAMFALTAVNPVLAATVGSGVDSALVKFSVDQLDHFPATVAALEARHARRHEQSGPLSLWGKGIRVGDKIFYTIFWGAPGTMIHDLTNNPNMDRERLRRRGLAVAAITNTAYASIFELALKLDLVDEIKDPKIYIPLLSYIAIRGAKKWIQGRAKGER